MIIQEVQIIKTILTMYQVVVQDTSKLSDKEMLQQLQIRIRKRPL